MLTLPVGIVAERPMERPHDLGRGWIRIFVGIDFNVAMQLPGLLARHIAVHPPNGRPDDLKTGKRFLLRFFASLASLLCTYTRLHELREER